MSSADEVRELAALGVAGYLNEYSAVRAHPAVDCAAPVPGQLQPPRQPAGGAGHGRVAIASAARITAALSLNLSRSGIAIRTASPPPRDTMLKMRFALPGSKKEMRDRRRSCAGAIAEVRHGHAVHHVKPADQAAIDEFVDAHFFRSVKTGS